MSADAPPSAGLAHGIVELAPGETIRVARESPVVVVPVYGEPEFFERCMRSVLRHTDASVPVLAADDATPDGSPLDVLRRLELDGLDRPLYLLRQPKNLGFPENVNATFVASEPGDVVLLNSDCEVGPGWLDRLRDAVYSDSLIATASALTNNGSILSVPRRGRPNWELPRGHDTVSAACAVAAASLKLRPRLPTAIGHCVYIRRSALELVGLFDPVFSPGYGEEVDFSQRCAMRGLVHVAADDVYVYHAGGASLTSELQLAHEEIIRARYPQYHWAVDMLIQRRAGPLVHALSIAEVALTGLSVTIDARCLGRTVTGTQTLVLELIRGLARTGRVELRVLVAPTASMVSLTELSRLGVEVLRSDELPWDVKPSAIIHRPYQVGHHEDLILLDRLGQRLVISHLDLIAYRTPGYARTGMDWVEAQQLTRRVLAAADAVLFISEHAAADAFADELVTRDRARVVYLGMDDPAGRTTTRPKRLQGEAETAYLLYVGTDFRHKNRLFALEILEQLQARHAWGGYLVFAGPHAAAGTSADDEAEFLASRPELARRVVSLGSVSESEKSWLYGHSSGVIYPTVYEGFGLIPFEAASFGRPTFFAPQAALAETLPRCATLVPWNAAASADAVHAVLADESKSQALVRSIAEIGHGFSWQATADGVLEVYEEVIGLRSRDVRIAFDDSGVESIATFRHNLPHADLSPGARRALLSLLARSRLRAFVLGPLTLTYSLGYVLKHGHLPGRRGI